MEIILTKSSQNAVSVNIPDIGIQDFIIHRQDDFETDIDLMKRAGMYGLELVRRHRAGEPYSAGYRESSVDGMQHLVIRKTEDEGKVIKEKIAGIDDDFVEVCRV